MKLSKFLMLCISIIIFAGCSSSEDNRGEKYSLNKDHEIYYKGDGVDEAAAKKVADILNSLKFWKEGSRKTVQIIKENDSYKVNFVVVESMVTPELEKKVQIWGWMISNDVFGGAPVTVGLCNIDLETFKSLPMSKPESEEIMPVEIPEPATDTTGNTPQ
jgi:hypothetical protein